VLTNILEVLPAAQTQENRTTQSVGLPNVQTDLSPVKDKETNVDSGDAWVDAIQRGMTFTVDTTARWLDQFFGDARYLWFIVAVNSFPM
ncbi:MAG: hypothetical protein OEX82_02540, partial [Nitrosomonas sp.]|nr:hypothetical protein [Nitrosomonas sp.]